MIDFKKYEVTAKTNISVNTITFQMYSCQDRDIDTKLDKMLKFDNWSKFKVNDCHSFNNAGYDGLWFVVDFDIEDYSVSLEIEADNEDDAIKKTIRVLCRATEFIKEEIEDNE